MSEMHACKIADVQRASNYHNQHYTAFLKGKFPFLFESHELELNDSCSREQALINMKLRAQSQNPTISATGVIQNDQIGAGLTKENYTQMIIQESPSQTQEKKAAFSKTDAGLKANQRVFSAGIHLDKKLKGQRNEQSLYLRPINEDDQISLINYENYIKNVVKSLYGQNQKFGTSQEERESFENRFKSICDNILEKIQKGQLNPDGYISQYQKMKDAVDEAIVSQIEHTMKEKILDNLRDGLQMQVEQFAMKKITPPKILENVIKRVEDTQTTLKSQSAASDNQVTITSNCSVVNTSPIGRTQRFLDSPKPMAASIRDSQQNSPTFGSANNVKFQALTNLSPELIITQESKSIDMSSQEGHSHCGDKRDINQKFIDAQRDFGTLNQALQTDGCHKYHDIKKIKKNCEETAIFKLLQKEKASHTVMRLAQVTKPGNTMSGFCDIGGQNAAQVHKLNRKLTKQLRADLGPFRKSSNTFNQYQKRLQNNTKDSFNIQSPGSFEVTNSKSAKMKNLNLRNQQSTISSNTGTQQSPGSKFGQNLRLQRTFTSINTSARKEKNFKDQVIQNIITKRQKRIKEIKAIINRHDKDESKKLDQILPMPNQIHSHKRSKTINTSMKGYKLDKSQKDKYFDFYIENGDDINFNNLETNFRKYLKLHNKLDEASQEDSNFIGYDKFGRRRCQYLEDLMAQMIRPRDMLEGEYSLGEQKVMEQIRKLRQIPPEQWKNDQMIKSLSQDGSKDEIVRMDSLVESAFNSEENLKWEAYNFSVKDPVVSERSEENHLIYSAGGESDVCSHELNYEHDQFSDYNDSGSSMTSNYSDHCEPGASIKHNAEIAQAKKQLEKQRQDDDDYDQDDTGKSPQYPSMKQIEIKIQTQQFLARKMILGSLQRNQNEWKKYTFFKILQGFRFPMLRGEQGHMNSINDIIDYSKLQMRIYKLNQMQLNKGKRRKLSLNLIDDICSLYQTELGASPYEIANLVQISGSLYSKNYHLSPLQLNSLAITLPYIINLKHINLEQCGMKDEQVSYIVQACQGLSKITDLHFGINQIGNKFVQNINDANLQYRIKELYLNNLLKTSSKFLEQTLDVLRSYLNLQILDISGNDITHNMSLSLSSLLDTSKSLENLKLKDCFKSVEPLKPLMKCLFENTVLRMLDISHSNFRNQDGEAGSLLGRLVLSNKRIVHLNIEHCQLSSSELIYMAMSLLENDNIMVIHLGFNELDVPSRNLIKIILGAETEQSLLYKLKNEDYNKPLNMITNKLTNFLLSRTLYTKWSGTMIEAIRPDFSEWVVQDATPFIMNGQEKIKQVECWMCNQHNHLQIETQNLIDIHPACKEIESLTKVFQNLEYQTQAKNEEKPKESVQTMDKKHEIQTKPGVLNPITENLRDHNTQNSHSLTTIEAQDNVEVEQFQMTQKDLNQNLEKHLNQNVDVSSSIEINQSQIKSFKEDKAVREKKSLSNPASVSKFYNFEKFQQGCNILPISRRVNHQRIQKILEENKVFHATNISAAPLQARTLQGQISKINEFEKEGLTILNQKQEAYQQYTASNGILYRDMQMRNDLLNYTDSSDGENNALIFDEDEMMQIDNDKKIKKKEKDTQMSFIKQLTSIRINNKTAKLTNQVQKSKKDSHRNANYGNRPKTQEGQFRNKKYPTSQNRDQVMMSQEMGNIKNTLSSLDEMNDTDMDDQQIDRLFSQDNRNAFNTTNQSTVLQTKPNEIQVNVGFDQISNYKADLNSGTNQSSNMIPETRASTQLIGSRMKGIISTDESLAFKTRNQNSTFMTNPLNSNMMSLKASMNFQNTSVMSNKIETADASDFVTLNTIEQQIDNQCQIIDKKQRKGKKSKSIHFQAPNKSQNKSTLFFDVRSGKSKYLNETSLNSKQMDQSVQISSQKKKASNAKNSTQAYDDLVKQLSLQWHFSNIKRGGPQVRNQVYIVGTFNDWMPTAFVDNPDAVELKTIEELSKSPELKTVDEMDMKIKFLKLNMSPTKINETSEADKIKNDLKNFLMNKIHDHQKKTKNKRGKSDKQLDQLYPSSLLKQAAALYKQQLKLKQYNESKNTKMSPKRNPSSFETSENLITHQTESTIYDIDQENANKENPFLSDLKSHELSGTNESSRSSKKQTLLEAKRNTIKKQLANDKLGLQKLLTRREELKSLTMWSQQKVKMMTIFRKDLKYQYTDQLTSKLGVVLDKGVQGLYTTKKNELVPENIMFSQYCSPGLHYFFFVKNGKCYIDNTSNIDQTACKQQNYSQFKIVNYPGTKIKMNSVEVNVRQQDLSISKPTQIHNPNKPSGQGGLKHAATMKGVDLKMQWDQNPAYDSQKRRTTIVDKKFPNKFRLSIRDVNSTIAQEGEELND